MAAIGLIFLMLLTLGVGALTGLIAVLVTRSHRDRLDAATSFGWGAVLGPIGIGVVVAVCRTKRQAPVAATRPKEKLPF